MMSTLSRLVLVAPLLTGCFVDKPPTDGGATGDTGDTGDTGTGPGQSATSASVSDPTTPDITGDPEPTTASTGMPDPTTGDPTASNCGDAPGQPLDSKCTDESGCGCQSGTCLLIPIVGGLCGQCTGDVDCMGGGCTMPDLLNNVGSRCNKGEAGAGCQTDAVCKDPGAPRCAEIYVVPGLMFEVRTCSACSSAADCFADAPNCTPVYDAAHLTGVRTCVADASLENGQGCSLTLANGAPEGNAACISGFCGTASVMGVLDLGVCGACNSDKDCLPGQTCSEATVDTMTGALTGASCV